ncbi:MAG: type II secretion system protein M [Gammaproteobacteria bacterium]|nr:type II secretion system protein M [Gammaproteobacteria bacterium]
MMTWWKTRSQREQSFLSIGAGATLAAVLYVTVLQPLQDARVRLAGQLRAEAAGLVELRALAVEAKRIKDAGLTSRALAANQTLLSVVNESAAQSSIQDRIKRVTPSGDVEASVAFDAVSFDALAAWLIALKTVHGIEATRLVVDRTKQPGYVNANVTLSVGG